jgi:hypothetical protein
MPFTHTFTETWSNGGSPVSKATEVAAGQEINIDETVTGNSTDLQINVGIDVSALKSLFMLCDRDITIQTNDGSSPDDTISLKANKPLIWRASEAYFANPLTVDVTEIFVTLAAGDDATLKIRALVDPTP